MYLDDFQTKFKWRVPVIFLILLTPIAVFNSLLFHTLVEGFSIIVSSLTFVVAYNSYPFSKRHALMFLGCGYFWVGILDFFHTISFSSYAALINLNSGATIQFWLVARLLESLILASFCYFINKPLNRNWLFWLFGAFTVFCLLLVLLDFLPTLYIENVGLTKTKVWGEYLVIAILLFAMWKVSKQKESNTSTIKLIIFSIGLTIIAEVFFTLYTSFSNLSLTLGHVFKLLSYWLIYLALVESIITQPFKSLSLSSDTFNALPDAITVINRNGGILHANQSAITSYSGKQAITEKDVHDVFHDSTLSKQECSICQNILLNKLDHHHEIKLGEKWIEISLSVVSYQNQNNLILHVNRDISLRKDAQIQYQTANRLYTVLRLTNKAIISNKTKQELLDSVCNIAVTEGGFAMAWIGIIVDEQVQPVSSAGNFEDYLNNITIRIDNSKLARGPVGIAANTKAVACVNNIETDPSFAPWREQAIASGYHSMAAVPIIQNHQTIGVFAIYSSFIDAFDSQILELLTSLSGDISSVITYIQGEEKRQLAETKLKQLSQAIEQSHSAMIISDINGVVEYVNPYYSKLTGYDEEEIINQNIKVFSQTPTDQALFDACWQQITEGNNWRGEIAYLNKNGELFWALQSVSPILNQQQTITHIIWTLEDNTELHNAHETISQLAYYDALTDLPNRRLFHDRFNQSIHAATRHKNKVALLYFDLDNFKAVNDSFGHDFGDNLLKYVAKTLTACVRETDTVTRLGGDEFSIILNDINDNNDVTHIANNILTQLNKKSTLDSREIVVSTSIGISLYPDDGTTIKELIKCADMAMYHAKEKGRNNFQFFEEFLNKNAQQRLQMENKIQHAIDNNEFILHYQPQFNLNTGELSGVEALIRWVDRDGNIIPPNQFIPIAEETILIIDIGNWVITQACHEFKQLIDNGFPAVKVAINISACQFRRSDTLLRTIESALVQSNLKNSLLQVELTESILIEDVNETINVINQLKKKNISFAIDDFGTGYSSLSYLKSFPADVIKIDRSFIGDIENDLNDRAIISAITAMAHELELKVLAEGVENEAQIDYLKQHHCDFVQGYFYAKPMPAQQLLESYQKKSN